MVVVGAGGRIVCVRHDNAEAVGEFEANDRIVLAGALEGDALFVAVRGGRLVALDVGPSGLRLLWEHVIPAEEGEAVEITTRPVIRGDVTLFGAADMRVRAVVR